MEVRRVLLAAGLLLLLVGCASHSEKLPAGSDMRGGEAAPSAVARGAAPRAPANLPLTDADTLRDGNAQFAGRLLALLARPDQNIVLSPFSISEALAMLYPGARGETAAQIAQALGFRLPLARLAAAFNAADQALAKVNGERVTLDVANTLFGQRGYSFRHDFPARAGIRRRNAHGRLLAGARRGDRSRQWLGLGPHPRKDPRAARPAGRRHAHQAGARQRGLPARQVAAAVRQSGHLARTRSTRRPEPSP
jgi:hypothetical protein